MKTVRTFYPLIPFILIFLFSCKQEEKFVTPEEAKVFAKQVEISIDKRSGNFFDDAVDVKEMVKRINLPPGSKPGDFKEGLMKGMKMGTTIVNALSQKGSYNLVKQYEKDHKQHLLFRMYDKGMINYHDIELMRSNDKCKVADIYIYLTGENLSETMHGIFMQLEDEIGKSDASAPWIQKMPEIRKLISADKHQEAMEIYKELPDKIKTGRTFQILHINISSGLSDEEYAQAIQEYEKIYPNEPNMQLLMIDGYAMRKKYDKALEAVNELDKMINKDPLLDFHRAFCYSLLEDNEKQKECLERLEKAMPYFEDGLIELISVYLQNHEFEKVKPLVERFKSKSEFDQSAITVLLTQYPDYNAPSTPQ